MVVSVLVLQTRQQKKPFSFQLFAFFWRLSERAATKANALTAIELRSPNGQPEGRYVMDVDILFAGVARRARKPYCYVQFLPLLQQDFGSDYAK